jgi:tetratricopeptide (TPR) repeat protein
VIDWQGNLSDNHKASRGERGPDRMSHPLPTDPSRGPGLPDDADRSARVEQLLLAGLDRYFAGQYNDAINIWTRVAFLDRDHARARAYIARARAALAEQQRESDEALERGIAAYHAGDVAGARGLLMRAVELGGASDRALDFLGRLGRLDGTNVTSVPPAHQVAPTGTGRRRVPAGRVGGIGLIALAAALAAVGAWLVAGGPAASSPVAVPAGDPLPVAAVGARALDRAAAAFDAGDLAGALVALDEIAAADPLRGEADQLRAAVQRALLGIATAADLEGGAP